MEDRPNPDELLARVQAEEANQARGKLKIFLGACAGVGKTYAMLETAHTRQADGLNVVVGYVETHGRAETAVLLEGLEQIPPRLVEYRGTTLPEFDLDAALNRRPSLILVDELAHTNAPGSRHAKRWQDVMELLGAGIHVYTTVNIQHLESLNDVVAQITGVVIHETLPDSILEAADEVELVDISPDDLLKRLKEGKVYMPQQAERAMNNFFRKGNLMALRELALRRTADRVDQQMQAYKRDHAIAQIWPAGERLLVCVSASPLSGRLIRATRRMAMPLNAEWMAVSVETPTRTARSEAERDRVAQNLRLAEQLGGETVMLSGYDVAEEIITYAHRRNVNKLVVGKPARPRWHEWLFGSVVEELIRRSGDIDVYVITGDEEEIRPSPRTRLERTNDWRGYAAAMGLVAFCTLLGLGLFPYLDPANLIMIYLLAVLVIAVRFGRGPSVLTAVLSVATYDFMFVLPYFSFTVAEAEYLLTFAVMLVVGLTISNLTARVRQQTETVRQREQRTASLYGMSRELARLRGRDNLMQTAVHHVGAVFESQVAILLPNENGRLGWEIYGQAPFVQLPHELGVAQWVYSHQQKAGHSTETLPGASALYLPLTTLRGTVGVMGVCPSSPQRLRSPEQLFLLETFADQIAQAVERAHLADEAQMARVQMETEKLRSSLLSSVSHDLRTPLAGITGAASTLLADTSLSSESRQEMTQMIFEEAYRLNRLVGNLLDMTRLESGAITVHKNWQPLEEVVGAAISRVEGQLGERLVQTQLPADLPLVPLDEVLIQEVLVNLLENAIKYTPAQSGIEIEAYAEAHQVRVVVADHGPGIPPGEELKLFEKFYRGAASSRTAVGVGLGLAICKGIVEAHHGRIWAENGPNGGARFQFTLPLEGQAPKIEREAEENAGGIPHV